MQEKDFEWVTEQVGSFAFAAVLWNVKNRGTSCEGGLCRLYIMMYFFFAVYKAKD